MTIALAIPSFTSVAVVADSRIAWHGSSQKDDILQKIYPINERTVLAFAGFLEGAAFVMKAIAPKIETYSGSNLVRDIEGWIRAEYRKLPRNLQKDLSFLLINVPEQDPKITFTPQSIHHRGFALEPNLKRPGEMKYVEGVKAIGCGRQEIEEIKKIYIEHISAIDLSFQLNNPAIHGSMLVNELMRLFLERLPEYVGGLFQCVLLRHDGPNWISYHSPGGVFLEYLGGRYWQRTEGEQERHKLLSVFEWMKMEPKPKPGDFGIFEDPLLRSIVNKKSSHRNKN